MLFGDMKILKKMCKLVCCGVYFDQGLPEIFFLNDHVVQDNML